jgi:hypothetical protein
MQIWDMSSEARGQAVIARKDEAIVRLQQQLASVL